MRKIAAVILISVIVMTLPLTAAGASEFADTFDREAQAYSTNLIFTHDTFDSGTVCCAQKDSNNGLGYIVYSFEGKYISNPSFGIYMMDAFMYAGIDNQFEMYVIRAGKSEYERVPLVRTDKGVVKENDAYTVTEATVAPAENAGDDICAVKIVVDPLRKGYVPYTIRLTDVRMELSDGDTSGAVIPEEKNTGTFTAGVTETIARNGYSETRYAKFTASDGKTYDYSLMIPDGLDTSIPNNVILYLHGLGGDTDFTIYENFLNYVYNCFGNTCVVVAPLACMKTDDYWVDYSALFENAETGEPCDRYTQSKYEQTAAQKFAIELYKSMCGKYTFDHAFIVGYSMGGYGTWDIITRYPDMFDAAVPVAGASDTSLAANVLDLYIWAFHGNADKAVDYHGSLDMYNAVLTLGGEKMKYTEYEGGDHGICYTAYLAALPWLRDDITSLVPASVRDFSGEQPEASSDADESSAVSQAAESAPAQSSQSEPQPSKPSAGMITLAVAGAAVILAGTAAAIVAAIKGKKKK